MKKSWLLGLLIPALFIAAWWLGYKAFGDGINSSSTTSTDIVVKSVDANGVTSGSPSTTQGETIIEMPLPEPSGKDALVYLGMDPVADGTDASACFHFRTPLNPAGDADIRDYIEVSPGVRYSHSISGNDLCLSGFGYDADYQVTLKAGLKAQGGKELLREITETLTFGDKPKYVGFAGNGIILPRIGAQGLAVESVNIDVLEIEVARVTDRMLVRREPQIGEAVLEGDYGWEGRRAATQIRSVIWEGEVDVKNERNKTVKTVLPLSELVGTLEPGAYIVRVNRKHGDDEYEFARAWRWIIVTDLAITSYQGADGLNIGIRSIDSAKPARGIKVLLVAENNELLAHTETDANGHANFAAPLLQGKDNNAARMVMAYDTDQDFAMLDLYRPPLDMSDHDVTGRNSEGLFDIYGFTERGVYRPGETVNFTAMLRDQQGMSLADRDVSLSVRRPNGIEAYTHRVEKRVLEESYGVVSWAYEVPNSAPRGKWSLRVQPDGTDDVEIINFAVADFVPQKIKITLKSEEAPIRVGEIRELTVDAQFLYGAPGTALSAEAEARIRVDQQPFKEYSDYRFGPNKTDFRERFMEMGTGVTDGAGLATFAIDYKNEGVKSVLPLRAEIVAGVAEPGGRFVQEALQIPVRTEDIYIGIANGHNSERTPRGQPAKFKVVAVDANGNQVEKTLTWKLVEEDWDYHWYRENGRWRYQYDIRDMPLSSGTIDLSDDAAVMWTHNIDWGPHRLEFWDGDKLLASRQFWKGWGRTEGRSTAPDSIEINRNTEVVKAGGAVSLTVNAPYSGVGELVIASNKIHSVQPLTLAEGTSEISFDFDSAWGDSVYALVTLYTPRDANDRPVPHRAVGVSYIALDRSEQIFNLDIETKDVLRPRQEHEFIVKVNGPTTRSVMMNFAAVDEGILQITKYESPDAAAHFFGKKALGLELRDDYGRILNPNLGTPATMRSGGDSIGGEGLTVVPTRTVSLFEGAVEVRNGEARIKLDIPDFNGELRLMATAWNERAVGSVSAPVKIRDEVPGIVSLPRFLAPGDKAFATVSLDNVEGQPGRYSADLSASRVVSAKDGVSFNLGTGERKQDRLELTANSTGIDTLNVGISGPGNYNVKSDYPIQVRSPFYPTTRQTWVALEAGETLQLNSEWGDGYAPDATDVSVSFARLPGIDPTPIVNGLRKYPYGCTEQTVSTAMPLIYASQLGGIDGQSEINRRREVQKAIHRISNRMSLDGSFGLWREGDNYALSWVGVYATDFLIRAKEEGYYVSDDVLKRAKGALSELSRNPNYSRLAYVNLRERSTYWRSKRAETAAYALYVMARMGEGNLGQARYHFDNHRNSMETPLSMAYLSGALKLMGDDRRALDGFKEAARMKDHRDNRNYYYSVLRDTAGIVAIASETGDDSFAVEMLDDLSALVRSEKYLNTQEQGYLILAFKSLMDDMKPISISAEGATVERRGNSSLASLYGTDLDDEPAFTNNSTQKVWASVAVQGPPMSPPEAISEGFVVRKTLFTTDGEKVDERPVKQGERLVVKLEFSSTENHDRSVVVADLLPAGFEIETVLRPEDGNRKDGLDDGPYSWLGKITELEIAEARDDRFVASRTSYRLDDYIVAYIVRAVTPGEYVMPGVVVEDMYRPEDHGMTDASRITISKDPAL